MGEPLADPQLQAALQAGSRKHQCGASVLFWGWAHSWRRLSLACHRLLQDSSSLLILHSYQTMNSSPAEASRRWEMGEPCSLSTTWRVLGPEFSPAFLLKPTTRIPLPISKGPCWLSRFISTRNLHLVSFIIPQEEQDFWFVIKTLWMMCQTEAYQPLGTDFDHRFWIYCWLIFKVIIQVTLFPRSLHAFVDLQE